MSPVKNIGLIFNIVGTILLALDVLFPANRIKKIRKDIFEIIKIAKTPFRIIKIVITKYFYLVSIFALVIFGIVEKRLIKDFVTTSSHSIPLLIVLSLVLFTLVCIKRQFIQETIIFLVLLNVSPVIVLYIPIVIIIFYVTTYTGALVLYGISVFLNVLDSTRKKLRFRSLIAFIGFVLLIVGVILQLS